MTFFDLTPKPEHRCPLPSRWFPTSDGWRCDCGKAYIKEALPARDVNPGEEPWQWRRAPEHDRRATNASCPNAPHTSGLSYDTSKDVLVCPLCGHEQYEEMGG